MAKKSMDACCGPDPEWAAESDLRTLIEAEKIKGDKERLKKAMAKKAELKKAVDAAGA